MGQEIALVKVKINKKAKNQKDIIFERTGHKVLYKLEDVDNEINKIQGELNELYALSPKIEGNLQHFLQVNKDKDYESVKYTKKELSDLRKYTGYFEQIKSLLNSIEEVKGYISELEKAHPTFKERFEAIPDDMKETISTYLLMKEQPFALEERIKSVEELLKDKETLRDITLACIKD